MKRCSSCDKEQPLTEFYSDSRAPDGKRSECKTCSKTRKNEWERQHRDVVSRRKRLSGRRHPEPQRRMAKAYKARYPERAKAVRAVGRALDNGTLVRPSACERCGTEGPLNGHHEDYDCQLDVIWLCPLCHKARHRELALNPQGDAPDE